MENVLKHHGVKGMKWGVRKDKKKSQPTKADIAKEIGRVAAAGGASYAGGKIATVAGSVAGTGVAIATGNPIAGTVAGAAVKTAVSYGSMKASEVIAGDTTILTDNIVKDDTAKKLTKAALRTCSNMPVTSLR